MRKSIETERGNLAYYPYGTLSGDTTPLLLIHGAGGTHLDWHIAQRGRLGRDVIAVELRGHGMSVEGGRQNIADYAADLMALIDGLGLPRVIVAGHSMGGAIALTMALDYATRLSGLILVGTGAKLAVNPSILEGIRETPRQTAEMLMKWMWAKGVPDEWRELGVTRLLEVPSEVIYGDYAACNGFDVSERLGEIDTPTLVIGGSADRMTPLSLSEQLVNGIRGSELVVIEGGGHMMALEQPQAVADAMRTWYG